jgi:hypothetical protein
MSGYALADSYAIAAVAPLLMTLLAIPMLGERVGWRRWSSCGVGFVGVLVMLQPGGDLWRWETGLLLVAVCGMAVSRIWMRVLAATDTPTTIAFWLMLAHIPFGLVVLPMSSLWPPTGQPDILPSQPAGPAAVLLRGVQRHRPYALLARLCAGERGDAGAARIHAAALGPGAGLRHLRRDPRLDHALPARRSSSAAGIYNVHRERVRRAEERAMRGAAA